MEQNEIIGGICFNYRGISFSYNLRQGDDKVENFSNFISLVRNHYEEGGEVDFKRITNALKQSGLSELVSDEFYKVTRKIKTKSLAWMAFGLVVYSALSKSESPGIFENLGCALAGVTWGLQGIRFLNADLARRSLDKKLLS